jgi:hypothetical protein
VDEISMPSTFEQLRTTSAGYKIRTLVDYLALNVTNPALINALLLVESAILSQAALIRCGRTLKWHFSTLEADDRGINETRANACEIVAWRFLSRISERDAVNFCLYELPQREIELERDASDSGVTERSTLLPQFRAREPPTTPTRPTSKRVELLRSVSSIGGAPGIQNSHEEDEADPTSSFTGLNGLEIAAVANCKKFLSQRIVQKIVTGIWKGDITFWESLTPTTQKKPHFYNKKQVDVFTRLRVPRYIKTFEVLFFATFLFLYYAVLVERNP